MRPKTTANIASNIPAFLSKLWKIVNDPDTDHLISWSSDGRSFIIQNQAQFWYNLLPIYYKHNNMSSFIRQLNMYGFHKISSESGGVDSDRDELKFYHPFFQQEQPSLMKLIKRKMAATKTPQNPDEKVANVDQMSKVLVDVKHLRGRQESVDSQLAAMKQENGALWQELAVLRQKHMKQQQIVNKLIHFLVHIVNPNRGGLSGLGVKRRYPLMINDARHPKSPKVDAASSDGPTIHELETESALNDTTKTNLLNLNSELLGETTKPGTSSGLNDFPLKDVMAAATEYIDINDFDNLSGDEACGLDDGPKSSPVKHILNPNMRDAIISNLVSGTKPPTPPTITTTTATGNEPVVVNKKEDNGRSDGVVKNAGSQDNSAIRLNSANGIFRDDLDNHLESTQGELDSIKDMLFDGYSLDANALLGTQNQSNNRCFDGIPFQLFNPDGDFPLDVPPLTTTPPNDKNSNNEACSNNYVDVDPMMSGELMSYTNQPFVLDFDHLFEESDTTLDPETNLMNLTDDQQQQQQLQTPIIVKKEPSFPLKRNTK